MSQTRKPLLAEEQQSEERRLKEEREYPFHGERLPDHTTGTPRELRPIRAELKLHRNACDHAEHEVHGKDPHPETCRDVIQRVVGSQGHRLQHYDQQRETHRQLWKEIVIRNREGKENPMKRQRVHSCPSY